MIRPPRATLTWHATVRLAERSRLEPARLLDILDRDLTRRVSVSRARSHLWHWLYWSPADQDFFVAVQDVVTGHVVTILTAAMFEARYPGLLDAKQYGKVINKAVLAGLAQPSSWRSNVRMTSYVSARLAFDEGPIELTLGRWKTTLPAPDATVVGAMEKFWRWVGGRIRALGLPPGSVATVHLRLPFGDGVPVPCPR